MAMAGLTTRAGAASTPAMLLLVGPPGSGKSTFSAALIAQAQVLWTRINQVLPASRPLYVVVMLRYTVQCPQPLNCVHLSRLLS